MRCFSPISSIEIFCFAFLPIDSRMYVLLTRGVGQAVIIDPCISIEADELLACRGIRRAIVLLTHEHYDHISGVNHLRGIVDTTVIASEKCAVAVSNPAKNLSRHFEALFCMHPEAIRRVVRDLNVTDYACTVDIAYVVEYTFWFEKHCIRAIRTPGHSKGSALISVDDVCLFTGDILLRVPVMTRLPGGCKRDHETIARPALERYDDGIMVYPGHGDAGPKTQMNMDV